MWPRRVTLDRMAAGTMSQQEQRKEREWEPWSGRKAPDEGLKGRLRALFTPGDEEDDVEALLAVRGRELAQQTENLAATVADLEARERKARELRQAVEDMLRQGSAELDERHAELNALATSLARREEAVARAETDISERRREAGAVELRRAAIERRETALVDREAALERIASDLQERERALRLEEGRLRELDLIDRTELDPERAAREQSLADREAALVARESELEARAHQLEEITRQIADSRSEIDALRRETALQRAEIENRARAIEDRTREAGDVSARERELETINASVDARHRELESLSASIEARERELQAARGAIAESRSELQKAVAAVADTLGFRAPSAEADAGAAHVLFLPGESYRLVGRDGPVPEAGVRIEVEGQAYRVNRVGASPLPGDRRRCAFLECGLS